MAASKPPRAACSRPWPAIPRPRRRWPHRRHRPWWACWWTRAASRRPIAGSASWRRSLGADDRQRLALRLAQGWIRNGRLAQADSLLVADSSVDAQAIRGRIALYRGDLAAARAMLADAGPFTGDRAAATERIAVLGLLQVIQEDSLPALGDAFYRLERRDSAAAAAALEKLAPTLPADHGGGELLLLAGQVRAGLGQNAEAEKLYRSVVTQAFPASAAAAEYALAGLLIKSSRKDQAVAALEHLLVTWPTSAVVPQARRLLDVARGAVPST